MHTEISAGSEQKFRLLAENIPGAVYLCRNDEAYSMLYINDHIEVITGYPSGDFLSGKIEISNLFHPDDRKAIFEAVNRGIAERKSFQLEYRLRHKSGEWRWIHETGIGLYEDDKLVMLEGFLQDITLQKSSEEKLR
ncbi:MAG TPA: PAS domain-containing protein, partial [Cyclobacteriaceae bacterium]|nr:PAS domain-containing protein [Cyclobacteriaceae bacterium]